MGARADVVKDLTIAGPDLDEAIHERVMGYRRASGSVWVPPDYDEEHPSIGFGVPKYSEKVALAWRVVEKLFDDDCVMETESSNGSHFVFVWKRYRHFDGVGRRAATFPLAICLAAEAFARQEVQRASA